jgi:hypothetical protein
MAITAWHDDIRVWLAMAVIAGVASTVVATIVMKNLNVAKAQAQAQAQAATAQASPASDDETRYHTAAGLAIRHDTGYSRR